MNHKNLLLSIIFSLPACMVNAQETTYTNKSIKVGIGAGLNQSFVERGAGLLYNIGYQTQFGKSDRLRINPNLLFGDFLQVENRYRGRLQKSVSLGTDLNGDLIRINSFSFVLSLGAFVNYSKSISGTERYSHIPVKGSPNFSEIYMGTKIGIGFKFTSKSGAFAYEFKPVNIMTGNNEFIMGSSMFGIDINFRNKI